MSRKPALAKDAILDKVIFPCFEQPKIDGVRGLCPNGTFVGRSLDPFKGFGITEYFSKPEFLGFDGEMTLGDNPASSDRLCSLTTGAMGRIFEEDNKKARITTMADLHWWIFDMVRDDSHHLPYEDRYYLARGIVNQLAHPRIKLVPYSVCHNRTELDARIAWNIDQGYEGTIIRNHRAPHKEGRATLEMQELWRVKPWQDDEMLCTGITEGDRNENEAKTNTLGHTERSSSKAGKVPNGQVGSIQGTLLKDIYSSFTGKLLFPKGLSVTVGSGKMTVAMATDFFQHPEKIVGHIVKFKHMTHGTKDVPRMGTFESLRLPQDLS